MKVLVAGAGAVGQWLGANLALADHEVTLLVRAPHADAIARHGIRVTGKTEGQARVACVTEVADVPPDVDLGFLTCKAHHTAGLAKAMAARVPAPWISLQNGLGNGPKLERAAPGRAALALTSHGLLQEAPGQVRHAGTGAVQVGPIPGGAEAPARLAEVALRSAGLEPAWHDDMRAAVWTKAGVNAGINPVAALHGVANGGLREPALWNRVAELVGEVEALARAAGIGLPDLKKRTRHVIDDTADNRCSMLQDVAARRPTEVEQISGAFVREARRLGHPMPETEAVYRDVKALEESYLGRVASFALTQAEVELDVPPA